MLKNKKNVLNALFVLVVFVLTIYSVFRGEDLGDIFSKVLNVSPFYLSLGIVCVVLYIYIESYIIHYMLSTLSIKAKKFTCFLYSGIGFFFSCITPGATGGQPAQLFYMKRDRIPIPIATVVLMIVTITFKFVLVVVGVFILIFQQGFMHKYLMNVMPIFYLGIVLNLICVIAMMILTFNQKLAKDIIMISLKMLEKIRLIKPNDKRTQKIAKSMDSYNQTAMYLREHKFVIVKVFLITLIQRFLLFLVTYFTYKAFWLFGTSAYDITMLQAVIYISVDMLPLPGGMGISEGLFIAIFTPVFGANLLMPAMVISRGLGYYTQLLFSAVLTCIAHFKIGKSKGEYNSTRKIQLYNKN